MLGAGAELAQRQSSSQQAMLAQAEQADRIAQTSAQAKLAALGQLGDYSTQMRSQEFGEEAQKASAEDIIAQFNALQKAGVEQRNVAGLNTANLTKQSLAQQLEADRVNAANQVSQWNAEAAGRKYDREVQEAGFEMSALTGNAAATSAAGANKAAGIQSMGSGLADIAMSAGKAFSGSGSSAAPTQSGVNVTTAKAPTGIFGGSNPYSK